MTDNHKAADRPDGGNHKPPQPAEASIPPHVIRRSLIISTVGTMAGAFFFTLIFGNIFSRYLEFVGLKENIGVFMGLPAIAAVTSVFGSWLMQRTGYRRAFFFLFSGLPRILWLAIITVPLWGPEDKHAMLLLLMALVLAYSVANNIGSAAWLSWMRDIVPDHYRGRLFSYRTILYTSVSAVWGLAAGYYLEKLGLDLSAFRTIFTIGIVFGVIDALVYFFVYHPPLKPKQGKDRGFITMLRAAAHKNVLKFTAVQAVWWFSCAAVGLSTYHMMRGIGMEIYSIQQVAFFGTILWLAFSLLWGRFLDQYGTKATFSVALLAHICSPLCFALAPWYGSVMIYLGTCFGAIAMSGLMLANTMLLFALSKREDQAMTMAARAFINGTVIFLAFLLTEKLAYPGLKRLGSHLAYGDLFYLVAVMAGALALRLVSFALWLRLPEIEDKPPAGVVLKMFYTTNPVRALYSLGRFLHAKSADMMGHSEPHPSSRWEPAQPPENKDDEDN